MDDGKLVIWQTSESITLKNKKMLTTSTESSNFNHNEKRGKTKGGNFLSVTRKGGNISSGIFIFARENLAFHK